MEIILEYGWIIFSILIFAWLAYSLKDFSNSVKNNPFGDYEEPRTAATLGVLFTFLGIAAGLFNFDSTDIQKSVQELLSGMKTAFVTSIVGMIISLGLKFYQSNAQKNSKIPVSPDANISDLIQYLQKSDAEKSNYLKALNDSLVGDGEYTVVGQIKMIRFEINEKFNGLENILQKNNQQMLNAFENFAETLAENNSKIFIEALNETMKDFNQKLSEQFGENFKHLNVAVGRLLEWQENYKQTVENTTKILQLTFKGIESAKNSIAEIEKSASTFKESSDRILKLLVTANLYEQKLAQVLKEIQSLGENAGTEFKNLAEQINNVTLETKNLTQQMNEQGNQALIKLVDVTEATVNSMEQILKTSCIEVQNYTELATKSTTSHISTITNNLSSKMSDTIKQTKEMSEQVEILGSQAVQKVDEISLETITEIQTLSRNVIFTSRRQREIMDAEIEATKKNIEKSAEALREDTFKITKKVSDALETMMKNNNENLKNATDNINKNLQETLNKSIEEFGHTMYLVSEKFVDDYTPLTEKLQKLVQLAENVGRR